MCSYKGAYNSPQGREIGQTAGKRIQVTTGQRCWCWFRLAAVGQSIILLPVVSLALAP